MSRKYFDRINALEELAFEADQLARRAMNLGCIVSANRLKRAADQFTTEAEYLWDNRPGAPIDLTKQPEGVRA